MKKIILICVLLCVLSMTACNNPEIKNTTHVGVENGKIENSILSSTEAITANSDGATTSKTSERKVQSSIPYLQLVEDDSYDDYEVYCYQIPKDNAKNILKHDNYEYIVHDNESVEIVKYNGSEKDVTVPSEINGKTVRYIGDKSFAEQDSVDWDFDAVHTLSSITIPDSVVYIGENAFLGCEKLTSVVFPKELRYIGSFSFYGCKSLNDLNLPSKLEVIDTCAFEECEALDAVDLPESAKYILHSCFSECPSLQSVTLNDRLEYIGSSAFNSSGIEKITIPDSVEIIDSACFAFCKNLEQVNFSFNNSKPLTIMNLAFHDCVSLKSIAFPTRLNKIGEEAFSGCYRLIDVYFRTSNCNIGVSAFDGGRYMRMHAPGGGNIESYCPSHIFMKFVPENNL